MAYSLVSRMLISTAIILTFFSIIFLCILRNRRARRTIRRRQFWNRSHIVVAEEWVTKKKVELTTTRQIATRVQRQLVLEDGKVVEDSGPIVSTNTTEDTEKQEHKHTEVRYLFFFLLHLWLIRSRRRRKWERFIFDYPRLLRWMRGYADR